MEKKTLISSESLKRVIIRMDYSGLMEESLSPWVKGLREKLGSIFRLFDEAECGSVSLDLSHPETISLDSGPGVRDVRKGILYLFQDGHFKGLMDTMRLEISYYYMALTIDCKEYDRSQPYREFMCDLMENLIQHDKFVRFDSLGIRKMDLFEFKTGEEMKENIAPMAMNFDLWDEGSDFFERKFSDKYVFEANESHATILDYVRNLRFVRKNNGQQVEIVCPQVIIDMDCRYYDKENIRPSYEDLIETSRSMNERLYAFFENSVTEQYKKSHEKQA